MKFHRIIVRGASAAGGFVGLLLVAACGGNGMDMPGGNGAMSMPAAPTFADSALVVDKAEVVASSVSIDPNLQNPWGIAVAPGFPFWISDNNSNLATLYSGTGTIETQAVTGSAATGIGIPPSAAGVPSNPTGQVYNGAGGFLVQTSKGPETALFIFDGEGGTIAAWAQDSGSSAQTAYDDGVANGNQHAVYKGLALGAVAGAQYLYATDLHNAKVDVFDSNFTKPAAMQGQFLDPDLPAGYAPFGIAALDGQLYVSFAKQDAAGHDEVTGAGLGYVDIFDFSGNLVGRFASGGALDAPWGMAMAPSGFGPFGGDILIGNFGDGRINAFMPDGTALAMPAGPLMAANGQPISFAGLWSLVFGNGDTDKPLTTLFYTAGFADQTDGVFGKITLESSTAGGGY